MLREICDFKLLMERVGLGECIRGNAMDFVDSAFGTEHKGHGATMKGQQQTAKGVANMEGHYPAGTAPVDSTAAATQTNTAAPAVPATSDLMQSPPVRNPGTGYGTQY